MSSKLRELIPKLRGANKKAPGKRVLATIERPKIDESTRKNPQKKKEGKPGKKDSFLEFSEISVGSELQYNEDQDDISELSSFIDGIVGSGESSHSKKSGKSGKPGKPGKSDSSKDADTTKTATAVKGTGKGKGKGKESKASKTETESETKSNAKKTRKTDTETKTKVGKADKTGVQAAKSRSDESDDSQDVPNSLPDRSDRPDKSAKSTTSIATPEDVIKANTVGFRKLEPVEYKNIKYGDHIKHINQNGYLTNGGYIIRVDVAPLGIEKKLAIFWLVSFTNPNKANHLPTRPYRLFPGNTKAVYIDENNTDEMEDTATQEIKAEMNQKQHYINDIVYYLYQKYDDFGPYMEDRERERRKSKK